MASLPGLGDAEVDASGGDFPVVHVRDDEGERWVLRTLVSGGELIGIVDWTDVVVGDPAADFRRIAPGFGPERLSDVLDAYLRHGGPTWPGMRRHIAERAAMAPVNSGLFGVDSGQDRYVRAARERFASWSPGTGSG